MYYEDVFRKLNHEDINYLVAGGLALNLHGVPRATQDLDLLLEMTDQNLQASIKALQDLGYRTRKPVNPIKFSNAETRRNWAEEKNMKSFTFTLPENPLQTVDLLFDLSLNDSDCESDAVIMNSEDLAIPVISVDDLIYLKKQADREVDELDLKMLRKLEEFDDE